jgi:NTE family protein
MTHFKNLVLSGGSFKSMSFIGCIRYLEENNINTIENVIGSSAGSLVGLLYIMGISSQEIKNYVLKEIESYNQKEADFEAMFNVFQTLGLDNGDLFEQMCSKLFEAFGLSPNTTFIELAKLKGKNFVVVGSNITKAKCEYFGVDTTPNMEIKTAIRISISLPIIFTPVILNDMVYVDACLFNHNPIDYFYDTKNPFVDTIALVISGTAVPQTKDLNLFTYIQLIFMSMLSLVNEKHMDCEKNNKIVDIEIIDETGTSNFDFGNMKFKMNPGTLDEYIEKGYNAIKQQLN